ncbi:MAG: glycosyltransferase family 4 protein [Lysobacterales bacterium]
MRWRAESSGQLRLAIVAPSAYLLGGVQTWLDYLVSGLATGGWQVSVLLTHGIHSDAAGYLQLHPFPRVHMVENPTGSREGRVRALIAAIRDANPDLVLVVNIVDCYEAVARMRRRGCRCKVAMALHGLHECFYQDIARYAFLLDGVIATNRLAGAAAVSQGGLPLERVHYAPCGVVVADLASSEQKPNELMLLYAGRFDTEEKRVLDLPLILHALARRGVDFRLRLAGTGPAEDQLRTVLKEFGNKIEFLGALDSCQIRTSFFAQGAIALVLSPSETGPLVAWEALANGVALVTSQFVGIGLEGSLRDGETCLTFPVGDTEAAAAAIERLADSSLRLSLVKAGYALVRERYSRDASVCSWNRTLRHILQQSELPEVSLDCSTSPAGRLDRWLGIRIAETVRRWLGLRFLHAEAGGEWPHSYGVDTQEDWPRTLERLDQGRHPQDARTETIGSVDCNREKATR